MENISNETISNITDEIFAFFMKEYQSCFSQEAFLTKLVNGHPEFRNSIKSIIQKGLEE